MHESNVHEALHQNCKIHFFIVGGQGPRVGLKRQIVKMYSILENLPLLIHNRGR